MDHLVKRITRCENCRERTAHVIRSQTKNPDYTDNDIAHLIRKKGENPQAFEKCHTCSLFALTTTVAWVY